jgi:osmotically-inducible protein OsmY
MSSSSETASFESVDPHQTEKAVRAKLRGNSYPAVRHVSCECHNGTVFLRGRLPSYHLKQIAQEVIARVNGVARVINEIEVGPEHD